MTQDLFAGFLVAAGLAAIAAGGFVIYRSRGWHGTLERFPELTTVDALESGLVALVGTVRETHDTELITGPMSGKAGVVVESQAAVPKNYLIGSSTKRRLLDWRAEWTPFELDDGTGRVRIQLPDELSSDSSILRQRDRLTERCFWGLSDDFRKQTGRAGLSWGIPNPDEFRDLDGLFDLEFGPDDMPPGKYRLYAESVIEPGDTVFVLGEVKRSNDWDSYKWIITADDPEQFLLSETFATHEGREDALQERIRSRLLGYGMGVFATIFGLAVGAFGLFASANPLRALLFAVLYLLVTLLVFRIGLGIARRTPRPEVSASFRLRSFLTTVVLGTAMFVGGGYMLATRYSETETLVTGDAWVAYTLLAVGAILLWSVLSAFLYEQYGIDFPLRGKTPGDNVPEED